MIPGFRWQVIILFGVTHCYGSVWWNNVMDPTCFFVILVTSCTCPSTASYTTEARKRSKVTLQNWLVDTTYIYIFIYIIFNFLSAEVKTPQTLNLWICPETRGPLEHTPRICVFFCHGSNEVYRDPVHDFGLFQFDSTELRFTPPTAIAVAPSELQLGFWNGFWWSFGSLVGYHFSWFRLLWVTILLILCSWKFEAWRWMKLKILLKVVCHVLIFSKPSETFHDTPRSWGSSSEFCIPKIYQNNIKQHYLQQKRRILSRTYVSYKSSTH